MPIWRPPTRIEGLHHELNHHPDTDSLDIDFSDRPSVESREVAEGVVLDYDSSGRLVGIDIDNAANKVELQKLILSKLPGKIETDAAYSAMVPKASTASTAKDLPATTLL
jgi:uncharacterized protein YuzE